MVHGRCTCGANSFASEEVDLIARPLRCDALNCFVPLTYAPIATFAATFGLPVEERTRESCPLRSSLSGDCNPNAKLFTVNDLAFFIVKTETAMDAFPVQFRRKYVLRNVFSVP